MTKVFPGMWLGREQHPVARDDQSITCNYQGISLSADYCSLFSSDIQGIDPPMEPLASPVTARLSADVPSEIHLPRIYISG